MKKILLFILFAYTAFFAQAQNYLISNYHNQTITTCSGTFYDSGGNGGNYTAGESYIVTITPSSNGVVANITFNSFTVGIGDILEVYDGTSINAPLLNIYSNGNSPVGIVIRPSLLNSTRSLTLRWTSATTNAGWAAALSCGIPCQDFSVDLSSSTPPFVLDSGVYVIDVCQGDTIDFTASPNFYFNYAYYIQDSATTTYSWDINGMTTLNGQSIQAVFNNPQGYNIYINALDSNSCPSNQTTEVRVRVSTNPGFTGTLATDTTICQNDTTDLIGIATPKKWKIVPSLSVAGVTYLPDGAGVSYTSNLVFSGFNNGQTLQSANDIIRIFAEIEHSYLGDLEITIGCPNGSSSVLKSYPNGASCFLGEPIDGNASQTPGIGYMYHWTSTGTTTMLNAVGTYQHDFTDVLGGTYTNQEYLPPSTSYPAASTASAPYPTVTYLPETPFTNLVGCPLNGAWTITVTDNLAIDNGFIFSWGIDFDPSVLPVTWGYTPIVDTTYWSSGGNQYVGTNSGTQTLTYTMVDETGCSYDTSLTIQVNPAPDISLGNDTSICTNDTITIHSGNSLAGTIYNWSNGSTQSSIHLQPAATDTYTLEASSPNGCTQYDTIEVAVYPYPVVQLSSDTLICIGTDATIEAGGGDQYVWNDGSNGNIITVSPNNTTSYIVTVTDSNNCASSDTMVVNVASLPSISLSNDTVVCTGTSATLTAGGGVSYDWGNGVTGATQTVSPANDSTFKVIVTDNNECVDSAEVLVEILDIPDATVDSSRDTICLGETITLHGSGGMYYMWNGLPLQSASPLFDVGPLTTTRIPVTVINEKNGTTCTDTTSYFIYVENCAIFIPSAFTPNGDNLNDEFGPQGIVSATAAYEMIIFDRLGKVIYQTKEFTDTWDGKIDGEPAPTGVYTYVIRVVNKILDPYELYGTITLIR